MVTRCVGSGGAASGAAAAVGLTAMDHGKTAASARTHGAAGDGVIVVVQRHYHPTGASRIGRGITTSSSRQEKRQRDLINVAGLTVLRRARRLLRRTMARGVEESCRKRLEFGQRTRLAQGGEREKEPISFFGL
ncbi:hypothetical protein NL676_038926 [Syzygium grande]|nr:hypothetical protein NL676_038926 [Syzygium grande]